MPAEPGGAKRGAEDVDAPAGHGHSPGRHCGKRMITSVTATTGTLIAKIQRHEAWSTIHPPSNGPAIVAIPPHAVHDPIAAERWSGGRRRR